MKAIVENMPIFDSIEEQFFFIDLLNVITESVTEVGLRGCVRIIFKSYPSSKNYDYGFGTHHMWVKENSHNKWLIFVDF
jgi:hypothetical protein